MHSSRRNCCILASMTKQTPTCLLLSVQASAPQSCLCPSILQRLACRSSALPGHPHTVACLTASQKQREVRALLLYGKASRPHSSGQVHTSLLPWFSWSSATS